ncbi:MAG: 23S rRNA (adenine(2030)-N(6))-methyltransferase RlmJ [Pseudomonadota bacterium]
MLSYQHAYHAGNAADLHKHSGLAALLGLLTQKDRGITYLESHAGRGLYDLDSAEAQKTGEAAAGVERLARLPEPLATAVAAIRAEEGPRIYPGSPAIASALLRVQDQVILCERHPGEHAALKRARLARPGGPGITIHRRDGHEGLRALTPPDRQGAPRRGLVLIDPSYEVKTEYAEAADTALAVLARWPEAVVALWYPILPEARHEALITPLARGLPDAPLAAEVTFVDPPGRGMTGSGFVVLNAPYGAEDALAAAWDACAPVFAPAFG